MLALLFPGQGTQVVGMGRDVCEACPEARAAFQEADEALGLPLSRLCFEGPEQALVPTEVQQPAILTASVALLRALEARGPLAPAYVAGHSLGEYTALVAAGALPLEDAVRLVHARGRFMQEAVPEGRGAMAAVLGAEASVVETACAATREAGEGLVEPANYNAPQQTVVAGEAGAVDAACARARKAGARRTVRLPVSAPFHCALMQPAAEKLAGVLATTLLAPPEVPVASNVDARPHDDPARIRDLLRRQVTAPVRFVEMVRELGRLGVTGVLEVGPGRVLTGLVARIDRGLARANLAGMDDLVEASERAAAAAR